MIRVFVPGMKFDSQSGLQQFHALSIWGPKRRLGLRISFVGTRGCASSQLRELLSSLTLLSLTRARTFRRIPKEHSAALADMRGGTAEAITTRPDGSAAGFLWGVLCTILVIGSLSELT